MDIRKPSLTQLPPEIICHISSFLEIQRISLALTCKQFYQLLKKDVKEGKKFLKQLKRPYTSYILNSRIKHLTYFTLTIKSVDTVIHDFIDDDDKEFIKKYLFNCVKCLPKCEFTVQDHKKEYSAILRVPPPEYKVLLTHLEDFVRVMQCTFCKTLITTTLLQLNAICSDSNFPKNSKGLEIIIFHIDRCLYNLALFAKCRCVFKLKEYKLNE